MWGLLWVENITGRELYVGVYLLVIVRENN